MKVKAVLSAVMGFLFGLVTLLVLWCIGEEDALALSAFTGIVFFALLFVYLLIHGRISDQRYAKIEKEIPSRILHKSNGNFNLGNGKIRNGKVYFAESGLIFISLDEKPHIMEEVLKIDIDEVLCDSINFNIRTKDGKVYIIKMPDAKSVFETLKGNGWIERGNL